ncbi:ribonuclease HII [Flavobacterium sp. Fl-77]|uniref:Ribonuclease HII n=1 Tax=Flavobacterium flavipigmentatum TaxID=2893884 RepID=A0AAJ2VYV4_9FLAO|nr:MULTISPECIES: ribonuclease HII [unclassified Flavobacterium]MDX6183091.1 ribonuclease HII [Flavobacterium sp. Fl-33]MDX6186840.1 ribonuclease HII [Flavobacterium sp. Fl-77]UFH40493.1 ribonuclease HII [Flavobacterium sp. F-70]
MLQKKFSGYLLESGTDEAGRGCLAGPVTAAAIILTQDFENTILNDSKQLSEKTRELLKPIIEENAICYAVTHLHPEEIDEINILNASMKGMQECILKLNQIPEFIIVDGNRSLNAKLGLKNTFGKQFSAAEIELLKSIPNQSIIKGDAKFLSIAAASVLAKTYRDEYMNKIHEEFPMYNWKKNKGYPTKEHREAIRLYGTTKYHRMSFRLLPEQLKLDF